MTALQPLVGKELTSYVAFAARDQILPYLATMNHYFLLLH